MQGWRKRQEDAHLAAVSKGEKKDIDVFGVFDGHGGKEISKFVSNHFLEELVANKNLPSDIIPNEIPRSDRSLQTTNAKTRRCLFRQLGGSKTQRISGEYNNK